MPRRSRSTGGGRHASAWRRWETSSRSPRTSRPTRAATRPRFGSAIRSIAESARADPVGSSEPDVEEAWPSDFGRASAIGARSTTLATASRATARAGSCLSRLGDGHATVGLVVAKLGFGTRSDRRGRTVDGSPPSGVAAANRGSNLFQDVHARTHRKISRRPRETRLDAVFIARPAIIQNEPRSTVWVPHGFGINMTNHAG